MLKKVKELLSTSFVYGLGNVVSKFIGFLLLPIFTRYLTPAEYGLFETCNVVLFLLTSVSIFGIDSALSRFYYDSNDEPARQSVISSSFFVAVILGSVITLAGLFFLPELSEILFSTQAHNPTLELTLWLVVLSVLNTVVLSVLQTKRQPVRYSILTLVRFTSIYGLSILFLINGKSVFGIMTAYLISYTATIFLGFLFIRKDVRLRFSITSVRKMVAFSVPIAIANISVWLLSSSDRFFLVRLASLNDVGLYSIGSRIASIVGLCVMAFQMAWPQFAFSIAKEENVKYTYARLLTYYLFVGIFLVLGVTLFAPGILFLFTTPSFAGGASVVLLLSCSSLLYGTYYIFGIILAVTKKTISFLPVTLLPMIANMALNYYLIPIYGVVGAGIASVGSYFLMASLMYVLTNRLYPIKYEWMRIVKMFFVAACVLGITRFVKLDSLLVHVFFKMVLLAGYVGALALLRFFNENERLTIKRIVLAGFGLKRVR